MIRLLFLCATLWVGAPSYGVAQTENSVARVLPAESGVSQGWFGRKTLQVALSKGVPFRVFTLNDPMRLVVDFEDLDWSNIAAEQFLGADMGVSAVRFGTMRPGWTRLVADLNTSLLPHRVDMQVDDTTGQALLAIGLAPASRQEYAAASGAPNSARWPAQVPDVAAPRPGEAFVVVIDPGHGGIDPGAEREGLAEKVLMLDMALKLRAVLEQNPDVRVVLTRESDVFVALETRVALAHQVGADLFVSLHADALSAGGAHGATVYTLSEEASDTASAHLAARHNRSDILAGVDLSGSDDEITQVLLDLARQETDPRSKTLADAFVASMSAAGGPMNRRPLRQAGFSVLKSADIPSVLIEVGFLSSKRDLENLKDPEWQARMTRAMAAAILDWREADAEMRALMRH